MKRLMLSLFVALLSLSFVAANVEAKRLGGGGTSGMQRQLPPKPTPTTPPTQQAPAATPGTAGAAAAAPAAAPKRSWLGPIAGLAAGLGLAALMSHLGMGAEFANILMLLMLGVVAFVAVRFLLRRFGPGAAQRNALQSSNGMQFAGEGFQARQPVTAFGSGSSPQRIDAPSAATASPPGFDAAGFERIAKLIFIRMQAANDAGNLEDLRQFSTPEMFATFRLDLQDRKGAAQQTDVVQLEAEVLDVVQEADRQIVSVRFHGLMREEKDAAASPFDEIWHFAKPTDGSREWAIAGIAQYA